MKNNVGDPCVSYGAITMIDKLDLNVYTHRGRPSKVEKIKSNAKLKKELRELKRKMNYKDNTEILLAVSVATDNMTRQVNKYPELFSRRHCKYKLAGTRFICHGC